MATKTPKTDNGGPPQTQPVSITSQVRTALEKMQPQFAMALPAHVTPERFVRVTMTAINNDPGLLEADRTSLYSACMKCAQDGLLPDGRQAALVKFKDRVVYMPMIGGILQKIRNSGELLTISSYVVYDKDEFTYMLGDNESILHRPSLDEDRGAPILAYAIARTKDGGVYREVMTESQLMAVRQMSRGERANPWDGPFADEMRRKTVLRRLAKRLPMSTDLEELVTRDDQLYDVRAEPSEPAKDVTARPRALQHVVDQSSADPATGIPDQVERPAGDVL